MSYRLLKVHWVKYRGGRKIRDLYSYHRSDGEITPFKLKLDDRNKRRHSLFHYSIGGKGFVPVSGSLHHKVQTSEHGIWCRTDQQSH